MTRIRRRAEKRRRDGIRFSRTIEEEVQHGIHWADYRSPLSKYLLPRPGVSAEQAARDIREARAHEIEMDGIAEGEPLTPPAWGHWQGLDHE